MTKQTTLNRILDAIAVVQESPEYHTCHALAESGVHAKYLALYQRLFGLRVEGGRWFIYQSQFFDDGKWKPDAIKKQRLTMLWMLYTIIESGDETLFMNKDNQP